MHTFDFSTNHEDRAACSTCGLLLIVFVCLFALNSEFGAFQILGSGLGLFVLNKDYIELHTS